MITLETIQNGALAVLCFLVCVIFVMAFAKPVPRHERREIDELAAKHDALIRTQDELAHEIGAEVQQRLADNRKHLTHLYTLPWSLKIVTERAQVWAEIRQDEELLRGLGLFGTGRRVLPESYDWL